MKKVLFAIIFIAALVSCEKKIPLPNDGQRLPMMNALIRTADTLHEIRCGVSLYNVVEDLSEPAVLDCYVNGVKIYSTNEVTHKDYRYEKYVPYTNMYIKAKFESGDKVELRLRTEGKEVSVNLTVPNVPEISSIDTSTSEAIYNRKKIKALNIKPLVKDVPNEDNWYTIELYNHFRYVFDSYEEGAVIYDGYEKGELIAEQFKWMRLDTSGEPLFNSGVNIPAIGSEGGINMAKNIYNLFTDETFKDKDKALNIRILDDYTTRNYRPSSKERYLMTHSLTFRIGSMNKETYSYLDALTLSRALESVDGIPILIPEIRLMSNVKGGAGFVGIIAEKDFPFEFEPEILTNNQTGQE